MRYAFQLPEDDQEDYLFEEPEDAYEDQQEVYEKPEEIAPEEDEDDQLAWNLLNEGVYPDQHRSRFVPDQDEPTGFSSEHTPSGTGSFSGIFRNEGARTGQPTNLNSSALGRGQMIRGTRYAMYKKLGITDINQAEQQFRTDPEFEMQVLNAYRDELDARIPSHIQGRDREYMIAKGWYTGNPFYDDNKVPGKSAGNKLTAGEYARRAVGMKYGGEVPYAQVGEAIGAVTGLVSGLMQLPSMYMGIRNQKKTAAMGLANQQFQKWSMENYGNTLPVLDQPYAQSGWKNPYQPETFQVNNPVQPSVVPQPVYQSMDVSNAQSAAGLQPQPNQNWQQLAQQPPQQQSKSGGLGPLGFLQTGVKLLANAIPIKFKTAEAATLATGLMGKLEANQQRRDLWDKWKMQQDKPVLTNASRGLEYKPLYAKHGGKYKIEL